MDRKIKKTLFISLIFTLNIGMARAAKRPVNPVKGNGLENEINQKKKVISEVRKQIIDIEKKLNSTNKRFLSVENEKSKLDVKIYQATLDLKKIKENTQKKLLEAKQTFSTLLVSSLNKKKNSKSLLRAKILKKITKKKIAKLSNDLNEIEKLEASVAKYKTELDQSYRLANELAEILSEMEVEKKNLANSYVSQIQEKEKLENKFVQYQKRARKKKKTKKSSVLNNSITMKFLAPLEEYISHKYDQEGITYKFHGDRNVYGPQEGKVIFSGPLANYGNVVVLDHGSNTRSILWGNFKPGVKKEQFVKKGQVIGVATTLNKGSGSLYFEVRHKKQVQNTFKLIEKERYSRNNTSVQLVQPEGT